MAVPPVAAVLAQEPVRVAAGEVSADVAHVLVPAELQDRTGVAEQVVGHAQAGREVGAEAGQPARRAPRLALRGHEPAQAPGGVGHRDGGEVEPHAVVEGQPVEGPRVLRVEAAVVVQLVGQVRRVVVGDHPVGRAHQAAGPPGVAVRLRPGVAAVEPWQALVLVLDQAPAGVRGVLVAQLEVAVAGVGVAVAAAGEVHSEAEAVRARDVGQLAPIRPAARVVVVLAVGLGSVQQAEQAVVGGDLAVPGVAAQGRRQLRRVPGRADRREARGLEARREVGAVRPRLEDARAVPPVLVVVGVPVLVRQREAELGQHPVARRAGPLPGPGVVVRRGPRRRRRSQVDVRAVLAEPPLPRLVEHHRGLVPGRDLPRQPPVRAGQAVLSCFSFECASIADPEVGGVPARRHEEPQPVAEDRTA